MIILKDYRIEKLDKYNYTFSTFKSPKETARTKSLAPKWTPSYKYYGTIERALEGIKEDILQDQLEKDYNIEDFIQMLDSLKNQLKEIKIELIRKDI